MRRATGWEGESKPSRIQGSLPNPSSPSFLPGLSLQEASAQEVYQVRANSEGRGRVGMRGDRPAQREAEIKKGGGARGG